MVNGLKNIKKTSECSNENIEKRKILFQRFLDE